MIDVNIFKGYYPNLDKALDMFSLEDIWGIQFSRREKVHSVTIVVKNNSEEIREYIDELAGFKVSRELYETNGEGTRCGLIAIDLGGCGTDLLRLYVSTFHNNSTKDKERWLYGIGYYLDKEGNVTGKKHYTADVPNKTMEVDYFDEEGNKISDDAELLTDDWTVWGGPKEIYDAVNKYKIMHQLGYKVKKDQAYFLVDPNRFY
jgi:hypothetical protein